MKKARQQQHKKRSRLRKTTKRNADAHKTAQTRNEADEYALVRTLKGALNGPTRMVVQPPSEESEEG